MQLRRTVTGLLAGGLALSLVAATQTDPAADRGTATTSLTAVDLQVTGVDGVPGVTLVDLGSFASTDADPARNTLGNGSPFARVGIVPLLAGNQSVGAAEATSDGDTDVTADVVNFVDPTGTLSATVNPVGLEASAAAQQALATAQAATASVAALSGALGLDVNTTGVVSQVTDTASTATQGLRLEGFGLDLGDLVPADVLGQLPVDVLISLLDQLPVSVGVDLQAIVDAVLAATDAVDTAAAGITQTGQDLAAALTELQTAITDLADLNSDLADATTALTNAQQALQDAQQALADLDLTNVVATATAYATECGIADPGSLVASPALVTQITDCLTGLVAADGPLQAEVDAAQATVDTLTADIAVLEATVDALRTTVDDLVTTLTGVVDDLVGALNDLLTALTDLDGSLTDVIDALAAGEILDVGAIDLGVVANATDTLSTSSATVGCNPVPVRVVGLDIATPDCSSPLEAASSAAQTAVSAIRSLLTTLPVDTSVVPDANIELFTDLVEDVHQDGDYVVAEAGVTALQLTLGSVTIDPANLVDGLLADLSAQVEALVAGAVPADADVTGLGLEQTVLDAVDALQGQLPTITDLQTQLADVLALLPDGSGLTTLTTPGVALTVDPTSTAQFAPAAAPIPPSGGEPAPTPAPDLPSTGGGLALLGVLSLGGAFALRRRR